jgi:hypothetical protein
MARLWQDLVLVGSGLTAATIPARDRTRYYAVLSVADEGDFNPLLQLVAERLCLALQLYLTIDRVEESGELWRDDSGSEWLVREDDDTALEYARWCRAMESFRESLEVQGDKFNFVLNRPTIDITRLEVIDRQVWTALRRRDFAAQPWFFQLNIQLDTCRVGYTFSFARPLRETGAIRVSPGSSLPMLLVREVAEPGSNQSDEAYRHVPLPFSALLAMHGGFCSLRLDSSAEMAIEPPAECSPAQAAGRFLARVIKQRLSGEY